MLRGRALELALLAALAALATVLAAALAGLVAAETRVDALRRQVAEDGLDQLEVLRVHAGRPGG